MIPKSADRDRRRPGPGIPRVAIAVLFATLLSSPAESARWNWSGAITLDHLNLLDEPVEGEDLVAKSGATVEWSLRTTVDVSDQLTVSTRVCTSCHGVTVDQAYAEIRMHPQFNLEAGRINVPFGDFYLRHDPANDAFLSKPLPYAMGHMLRYQKTQFNLGVLPMPYVDQGVTLYGDTWIRDALQVWYAIYGVNGFRAESARDFTFKSQVADAGASDNNDAPSWGGRLALAQGPVAIGASYLRGAYDAEADFDYDVWGLDGSLYVRGVQIRGEYLVRGTEVLEESVDRMLRKKGFYAQIEVPAGTRFDVVGRVDGLLRQGPALGTDNDDTSGIVRWTAGLNYKPTIDYALRIQYENWRFTDFDDSNVLHLGAVITY